MSHLTREEDAASDILVDLADLPLKEDAGSGNLICLLTSCPMSGLLKTLVPPEVHGASASLTNSSWSW